MKNSGQFILQKRHELWVEVSYKLYFQLDSRTHCLGQFAKKVCQIANNEVKFIYGVILFLVCILAEFREKKTRGK